MRCFFVYPVRYEALCRSYGEIVYLTGYTSHMELSQQKCVPCEGGMPAMSQEGIEKNLPLVPGWELQDDRLVRLFVFKDFVEAMVFVNAVAGIAEHEGHHPDLSIFYNKVAIALSTHAVNGLSVNDFILAAKINEIDK